MVRTTPKTDWANGELVTAAHLNAIGENLAAVRNLGLAVGTTTAEIVEIHNPNNAFINVDSVNLNLTILTFGGDVLAHFHGAIDPRGDDRVCRFDIEVDGTRLGGDTGIMAARPKYDRGVCFTRLVQNLSPGSHMFNLQWKHREIRLLAGAQFWVREI